MNVIIIMPVIACGGLATVIKIQMFENPLIEFKKLPSIII